MHYISGTYNPSFIELILKPVLMYLNATDAISGDKFEK